MNKILIAVSMMLGMASVSMAASKGDSADPDHIVQTAPQTNRSAAAIAVAIASTASVTAVTCSSNPATAVDTAFNALALAALGADYQRAELLVQNKDTEAIECGYNSWLTTGNGFVIDAGGSWTFSLGKNVRLYCIAADGSTANLRVGGIAWKK